MSATTPDTSFIIKAIEAKVKHETDIAIKSIIDKAKEAVEMEIKKSADKIALSVMSYYSVQQVGSELIITVKKEGQGR